MSCTNRMYRLKIENKTQRSNLPTKPYLEKESVCTCISHDMYSYANIRRPNVLDKADCKLYAMNI